MNRFWIITFGLGLFSVSFAMDPQVCHPAQTIASSIQGVKECKILPKLIVFDFHGTLSLDTTGASKIGNLKDRLKKYNNNEFKPPFTVDTWLALMQRAAAHNDLKVEDMVPRLDDLLHFISHMNKQTHNAIKFAIASNLEQDSFIIAMMKYCFENRGMQNSNPFNENSVVGTQGLLKYGAMPQGDGKMKHIDVLLRNMGLQIDKDLRYNDIVLIDNSGDDLAKVRGSGVKPIAVDRYFRIDEWNKQYQ